MSDEVVDNARNIIKHGRAKYNQFVQERLSSQKEAFTDSIPLTKLKLFQDKSYTARKHTYVKKLRNENKLNTKINKAIQAGRDTSLLISQKTSEYPSSLTKNGRMYHGTKSEILQCLPKPPQSNQLSSTALVLDGAAVIQMKRPGTSITLMTMLQRSSCHTYFLGLKNIKELMWFGMSTGKSLKPEVRRECGAGIRLSDCNN